MGTGYSYCDSDSAFTTDVSEIATDLVTLYSAFLEKLPIFEVKMLIRVKQVHVLCMHETQTLEKDKATHHKS